jgi:hypothetical protein
MGRRLRYSTLPLAMLAALILAGAAQAHHKPRFQLFGTATHAKDPTDPANHVIKITTSAAGAFGVVRRELNTKITTLDDHLSVSYYFVSPLNCFGGSPRFQLAVDTNGDGISNGNAFGYIGDPPGFTGCDQDAWRSEDLTISVAENAALSLRWDLTQFGGAFYNTWDMVKLFFQAFPDHRVLRGSLVADAFVPVMEGVAFYDEITIGYRTLDDSSDTIGN